MDIIDGINKCINLVKKLSEIKYKTQEAEFKDTIATLRNAVSDVKNELFPLKEEIIYLKEENLKLKEELHLLANSESPTIKNGFYTFDEDERLYYTGCYDKDKKKISMQEGNLMGLKYRQCPGCKIQLPY